MKELRFPKRGGGFRVVVAPSRHHKRKCRALLPYLEAAAIALDAHGVQHGFTPGRSPVTHARRHIGYRWTVSWDLAGCFDHVTAAMIGALVPRVPDYCYQNGIARQGLPTSPALANIALAPLDSAIVAKLFGRGVYTRYADDLTVSTNDRTVVDELLGLMPELVRAHGFELAMHKTEIQDARRGRRHVTGVAVDDHDVYPRRRDKRRLRAAIHQGRASHAHGLAEWTALKPPNWVRWAGEKLAKAPNDETRLLVSLVSGRESA